MKYNYKRKYKIGDIIPPFYNDTAVWYKESVWSVVTKVDEKKHWKQIRHWYHCESAELHSQILKLKQEMKTKNKDVRR